MWRNCWNDIEVILTLSNMTSPERHLKLRFQAF